MAKTAKIQKEMMMALKEKQTERKEALSLLLSALKAKAKDKREDLTEAEEDAIIKKEIKQTRETMDAAPADRADIREQCQFRLSVYQEFAPEEMGEDQIRALVQQVLDQLGLTAPTMRDKGPVMKNLMPLVKGKADGKLVNQIVGGDARRMKRLIIMGDHILPAAKLLFADSDKYTTKQMAQWPELEITVQDDGSYAVWVNLIDDADLLQDRKPDHTGMVEQLLPYVDETIED